MKSVPRVAFHLGLGTGEGASSLLVSGCLVRKANHACQSVHPCMSRSRIPALVDFLPVLLAVPNVGGISGEVLGLEGTRCCVYVHNHGIRGRRRARGGGRDGGCVRHGTNVGLFQVLGDGSRLLGPKSGQSVQVRAPLNESVQDVHFLLLVGIFSNIFCVNIG